LSTRWRRLRLPRTACASRTPFVSMAPSSSLLHRLRLPTASAPRALAARATSSSCSVAGAQARAFVPPSHGALRQSLKCVLQRPRAIVSAAHAACAAAQNLLLRRAAATKTLSARLCHRVRQARNGRLRHQLPQATGSAVRARGAQQRISRSTRVALSATGVARASLCVAPVRCRMRLQLPLATARARRRAPWAAQARFRRLKATRKAMTCS